MKYLVFFAILILLAVPVAAAPAPSVMADGEYVNFADQEPVVVDGRTLVPVRGVFEHLGFVVDWEQEAQTAVIANAGYELRITVGSHHFTVNGVQRPLDVPAQIINNRTMLPIRLPLESVGISVGWDEDTRTVIVTTATSYEIEPIHMRFAEYALEHGISLTEADFAMLQEEISMRQALFGDDLLIVLANEGYSSVEHLEQALQAALLTSRVLTAIIEDPVKFAPFEAYMPDTQEEELLGAKHILVTLDEFDDDEDAAMEFAQELHARAIAGEDFDELKAEYSRDPGKYTHPDGYTFTSGVMVPEFEQGTRDLEIGGISEPIRGFHGIHIILRIEPDSNNVMRQHGAQAPTREQQMTQAIVRAFEAR